MSKLSFTVEYFSDIEGEPYGIGSVPHTETLVQKMDESQSQFGARIVDFINTCNDPLTRLEDVFSVDNLDLKKDEET